MTVSDDYIIYIQELLQPLGELRVKRMFGGAGIYCDEHFFAIIADDQLYLKADDQNRARYTDRDLTPFRFISKSGKQSTMNYYPVPADVLESAEQLLDWSQSAIDAALRAKRP